jgi:hypothetical protein
MAARKTGIKGAISLVSSGLTIVATRIKLPSYTMGTFETPNLALDSGDVMPNEPEDLAKAGTIEVEFEADESIDPADFVGKRFDTVITYPVPASLTNGATDTHEDAIVSMLDPGSLAPNERRLGSLQVQVSDYPTKEAAD